MKQMGYLKDFFEQFTGIEDTRQKHRLLEESQSRGGRRDHMLSNRILVFIISRVDHYFTVYRI